MNKVFSIFIIFYSLCFSATFDLKYGGSKIETGYNVIQSSDGSFVVVGSTNTYGTDTNDYDGYIIKTNSNGSLMWEKTLTGLSRDFFIKVKQTADDGYVVLGKNNFEWIYPTSKCVPWLVKYDKNGKLKWQNTYDQVNVSLNVSDFIIADDGGFLVLGRKDTVTGTDNVWLMKTDSQGQMLWEKVYDAGLFDEGISIIDNFSGGYLLICNSERYFNSIVTDQVWVINIDTSGNMLQNGLINNSSDHKLCGSICATPDSSFVIVGAVNSEIPPPPFTPEFNSGIFISKFSSGLTTEWVKYYNTNEYYFSLVNTICNSGDNGFVISGTDIRNSFDLLLAKIDGNGNLIWTKLYGGPLDDQGTGNVIKLADDSFVVCGMADFINSYLNPSSQVYLIKTDELGNVIYPPVITSISNESDNVTINWEDVSNAGSYIVYGSDRPDLNFTAVDTTSVNSWTTTEADSLFKKFYYIKASTNPVSK